MQMNREKCYKIYKVILIIILTALVTFTVTTMWLYKTSAIQYITLANADTTGIGSILSVFKQKLDDEYLYDIDENAMIEAAIKAYVGAAGDEYTEYFTSEEMEKFTTATTGNYVGIGIYMYANLEENEIIISYPIKGGPAEEIGIKSGDIITKINGKSYDASEITELSEEIKGEAGTTVEIEIKRNDEIMQFNVERRTVEIYTIEGKVLNDNIGYIPIYSFDEGCSEEFKNAYEDIKNKGITSLIIDLRDNGGGLVDEAMKISEYILDIDSTMLITVDKKNEEEVTKSKESPIINMPIVVLVNENTASASEMLTGALQDNQKAKVVGTTTYGKGVIQELYTLKDGSGLKITIKEYYTPNKNKINKTGIKPDYEVEYSKTENSDTQVEKAIELLK